MSQQSPAARHSAPENAAAETRRMPPVIDATAAEDPSADQTTPESETAAPAQATPEGIGQKIRPLVDTVRRAFTEHPAAAGESYWQHLWFTLSMGARLMFAGFVILLHGLFPFMLTYTGSNQLKKCNKILSERAVKAQMPGESPMPYGDHI